jgi:hypothetical protein
MQTPEDLWANHSKFVYPKPHMRNCVAWSAMIKVRSLLKARFFAWNRIKKVKEALKGLECGRAMCLLET